MININITIKIYDEINEIINILNNIFTIYMFYLILFYIIIKLNV